MNDMNELAKLYEEMRDKEQKRSESGGDDRIIKPTVGHTYKFRLLWIPNPQSGRKEPIINKHSHMHKDENGLCKFVTCPTSEYLLGKQGFNVCPVCKHMNGVYNEYKKTNSPSAKDFFDLYKRQLSGYALVYVITDPVNSENNGTVKIFKHSFMIYKFLKWEIFGIKIKSASDEDKTAKDNSAKEEEQTAEIVGIKAFDINNGYDYILTVAQKTVVPPNGQKKDFPEYNSKFSRNPTSIGVPMTKINEMVADLRFDEDFYTKASAEDLDKFLNDHVLAGQVPSGSSSAKILHDAGFDAPPQRSTPAPAVHDDGGDLVGSPAGQSAPPPKQMGPPLVERQQPAPAPTTAVPASGKASGSSSDVEAILARINRDFTKL